MLKCTYLSVCSEASVLTGHILLILAFSALVALLPSQQQLEKIKLPSREWLGLCSNQGCEEGTGFTWFWQNEIFVLVQDSRRYKVMISICTEKALRIVIFAKRTSDLSFYMLSCLCLLCAPPVIRWLSQHLVTLQLTKTRYNDNDATRLLKPLATA